MKDLLNYRNSYTFRFWLPLAVSVVVFFSWFYGQPLLLKLNHFVSPAHDSSSLMFWQEFLILLLLGSLTGILLEKYELKTSFPILGAFLALWLGLSYIAAQFHYDLLFLPVAATSVLVVLALYLVKIWRINLSTAAKLEMLALSQGAWESAAPDKRIESAIALLKTILPVMEAAVFEIDEKRNLKLSGRFRAASDSGQARQAQWREVIAFSQQAITKGATLPWPQNSSNSNKEKHAVATPLINRENLCGVLFLELSRKLEADDILLLENMCEQIARNLNRATIREQKPSGGFLEPLSLVAAERLNQMCDVAAGLMFEHKFGMLSLSKSSEAHAVAYLDGTLVYLNQQMRKIAGLKTYRAAGMNLLELLDKFRSDTLSEPSLIVKRIMQTGETHRREVFIEETEKTYILRLSLVKAQTDDQSIHDTTAATRPLCFLLTMRDVSSEKELEKLRSDMVSLMSHELRTPVTSIKGFAELLQEDNQIPSESREFLTIIANEAQRLSKMLSTFLSVAKLQQSDKVEVVKSPVKLDLIAREVVKQMNEPAKRKRIRLTEAADPFIPPVVVDKSLITRALGHLVDNAIKYSPERTAVSVVTKLEAESLRIIVEDKGYGIPADEQDKIWQKFYRVMHNGNGKEDESTGLGLSLVKEIVEQHGGAVFVESEPGRGSRFSFTIPRL